MQFIQFFTLVLTLTFALVNSSANAQEVTTNELGEKIIIYPDGSWKYLEEDKKGKKTTSSKAEDEKEEDRLLREVKERNRKAKKDKKKKKKKNINNKKNKVSKISEGSKGLSFDEAEEKHARNEAVLRADRAAAEEVDARQAMESARLERVFLEEKLEDAYGNTQISTTDLIKIEKRLKAAKVQEKVTIEKLKTAEKRTKTLEKMIGMNKAKRDKLWAKMQREELENKSDFVPQKIITASDEPLDDQQNYTSPPVYKPYQKPAGLKAYNPAQDVIINPPSPPCIFAFNDIDEFTGMRRRDLAKREFFTFTSERLRPYFKDRDHIRAFGFLSEGKNGLKTLSLEIEILSEHAQREFGILEKGSILSIKLIEGNTVKLINAKTATGVFNKVDKTVTYHAQYFISSDNEKDLKKSEVDKVRVVWGTGYEDYEVYELDFFIDQLECLNQKS